MSGSSLLPTIMDSTGCSGCYLNFFARIKLFYEDDEKATLAFKHHLVLPDTLFCPTCGKNCYFCSSKNSFFCRRISKDSKSRKIKCAFSVSINKNTWLEHSRISPSQNILFCSLFLEKFAIQRQAVKWLKIGHETAVNWRNYCYEVCEFWFEEQKEIGIGGPAKIVEIDESLFGKSSLKPSKNLKGNPEDEEQEQDEEEGGRHYWVFGCIERDTKRVLLFPVSNRDEETLIPIIKKHILPGTTIHSDHWKVYSTLSNHGYTHHTIPNEELEGVHTQTIQKCWRDAKSWTLRSGNKKHLLPKYLSRYMFCKAFPEEERLHYFLETVAKMYKHPNSK